MHAQSVYTERQRRFEAQYQQLARTHRRISLLRIGAAALALYALWQLLRDGPPAYWAALLLGVGGFISLVAIHARVARQSRFAETLAQLNAQELAALQGDYSAFGDGQAHADPQHFYTWDLDVFGKFSLYQSLNRTATAIGAERLARFFLNPPPPAEIPRIQQAVQELSTQLDWRQELLATGRLFPDQPAAAARLLRWAEGEKKPAPKFLRFAFYGLAALTVGMAFAAWLLPQPALQSGMVLLLLLNLSITAAYGRRIKDTIGQFNAVHRLVSQYARLLQSIEQARFSAPHLQQIQNRLQNSEPSTPNSAFRTPHSAFENHSAFQATLHLSVLLGRLESIQNLVAMPLFSGFLLFHVQVLFALDDWSYRHARHLKDWLDAIAEIEALNSLAHLAYNNPDFVFPESSETPLLDCRALGHPLIAAGKRVCNDIVFKEKDMVVLTGSNMSGKSTFLRTLGLNLLLARTGAPVCAQAFRFYPFELFVSMKLSDSLHDDESYFYAELKRLKNIISRLEAGDRGFVLLDEVLRGTNSNDKLSGTLGLLEKMLHLQASGILATHDLKVCEMAARHPAHIRNMCFEVNISETDIAFDYVLREGICVNKSAAFLMRKMGIIEG